jgi:hypothetical protein
VLPLHFRLFIFGHVVASRLPKKKPTGRQAPIMAHLDTAPTRPRFGTIEAPDAKAAEAEAVKIFDSA